MEHQPQPQPTWLPPLPPAEGYATGSPGTATPPPGRPSRLKRATGPLAGLGVLLAKFKGVLLLLPKLKLLATTGSMLVSVAAYTVIWGWRFAIGFVALLFVHEMGHVIQMRREGIKPSGMLFIPFLGAVVGARSLGGNALAEARIGLAGPVVGTLASLAILPFAHSADSDFLRALAFTGFFLNLFNLIPLVPMDGGRAMAAMAPWMWFVGFAAMLGFFVFFPNPILVLFLFLGGMESWRRWKKRRSGEEEDEAYYRVRPLHRFLVGAVYVGLIAVLVLGMDLTFLDQSHRL
jgi:Zn-dependent protease